MAFLILTFIFIMAAKKPNFYGRKRFTFLSKIRDSDFCKKCDIFFGFSVVVWLNQGVQLKDRLF